MEEEQKVYDEFINGDLRYLDAIERLAKLYDDHKEAERVVTEWADANSQFGAGA
jgi:hypothetical protein